MRVHWPIRIAGLGRALPERCVENSELAERFNVSEDVVFAAAGVRNRYRVAPGADEVAALGARAGHDALARAGIRLADVDLIVNASGTPQQALPDGASLLQHALGAEATGTPCVSVHTTCLSFLSSLQHVGALMQSGVTRCALVISVDASSAGLDPNDLETNALLGDGAAAAVIVASDDDSSHIDAVHFQTFGEGVELTSIRGGGSRFPPGRDWSNPSDIYFRMDGLGLLKLVLRRLPKFLEGIAPGVDLHAFPHVIPHQASPAAFSVLSRLGFDPRRIHETLESVGNCVAASIPLTLELATREGAIARGDRVLLLGSGAGVSFGAVALTY